MDKDNVKSIYQLSYLQEGMLYYNMYNSSDHSYHLQSGFWVDDEIDMKKVKQSLRLLAKRHEVLKTSIIIPKATGRPWQVILNDREIELTYSRCGTGEQKAIEDIKEKDLERGFHLQNDSLMRLNIISYSQDKHYFLFSFHHIIVDGWCMTVIFGDFLKYYQLLNSGLRYSDVERKVELEKESCAEYKEYIEWLEEQDMESGLRYWKSLIESYDELATIHSVKTPLSSKSQMNQVDLCVNSDIIKKLERVAKEALTTINIIVETAWGIVLQAYNGIEDVVFGKVVSGRNANISNIDNTVGLFINTIPVRVTSEKTMQFSELIHNMQEQWEESNEYDYCSLAEIQKQNMQGSELIQTIFVFENYYIAHEEAENSEYGLHVKMESNCEQTTYPITVSAKIENEELFLSVLYNPNKYAKEEIENIIKRLEAVLDQISKQPSILIGDISLILPDEKYKILTIFNDTTVEVPNESVVALFEKQVDVSKEKIAAVYENTNITYDQLNKKSNQLAYKLRKLGIGREDCVAILARKSIQVVVGVCGILKSGAAYVPIDASYPAERMQYIINDCKPKVIILYQVELPFDVDIPVVHLEENTEWTEPEDNVVQVNQPEDLAYCIYTSGTTGNPKGVMIEHKSIIRLVVNSNYTKLDENMVLLQTGQLAFDASTFEIWGCLLNGGQIHLMEESTLLDFSRFKNYLIDNRINTMFITTALFNQMLSADQMIFDSLSCLLFGGEKTSEDHVDILSTHNLDFHNVYGPTETTTFASHYIIPNEKENKTPIGRPIANTKIFIVRGDKLCGIGMPGELCIAGPGVARGYLNRPELTKEKFVKNPFEKGIYYRSGDLARWLPDGNIEYLGRIDEQVKIRGFRIELDEIKTMLRSINEIEDVAVIVREQQDKTKVICAYLVSDKKLDISLIRDKLRVKFPEYMIPAYMMQIDTIPIAGHGKVNKRELPEIELVSDKEYLAPRNMKEKVVCQVFEEILGLEQIGVQDSFLELGGDSIKAIRVVTKIKQSGYQVTLKDIMKYIVVESIAKHMHKMTGEMSSQDEVSGKVEATSIIRQFESWNMKKPEHFNQDVLIKLHGANEEKIEAVLRALAIQHDMLRAIYKDNQLEILNSKDSRLVDFQVVNLEAHAACDCQTIIEEKCTGIQESIELVEGPLFHAGLFICKDEKLLFLCIHHLVVDGVSWRILLEDFETALLQVEKGQKVELPAKTTSFIEWSYYLRELKNSPNFDSERKYWKNICKDLPNGVLQLTKKNLQKKNQSIQIELDNKTSSALVREAGTPFHAEINELLLGMLGYTVKKLTGQALVTVAVEGHGRETLSDKCDVNRTVGWFTSIYPYVIECKESIRDSIIENKDKIRQMKYHGMGYGIVTELMPEDNIDITFNYLGEMDAENRDIDVSYYATGKNSADENYTFDGISITGMIEKGKFFFRFEFNAGKYEYEEIDQFAQLFKTNLIECVQYCLSQKDPIFTVSDFNAPEMISGDLKYIFGNNRNIDKIYSLTAMQLGILYHSMTEEHSTSYVVQHVFAGTGEIDKDKIEQALQLVVNRYDAFRTAFIYEGVSHPVQVVLKERKADFTYTSLEASSIEEQKEICNKYIKSDVRKGFDLQKDCLLRVRLIDLENGNWKMVWTYSHIIIDGWCLSLVYGDFLTYYEQLIKGYQINELMELCKKERMATHEYEEYLNWFNAQNKESGIAYWKEFLKDYEEIATIEPLENPQPSEEKMLEVKCQLPVDISKQIMKNAIDNQVTISNVLEAAWGLTLQQYNFLDDVVFGKVVSGRDASVEGIENMVGLFINTLPVRVKTEKECSLLDVLKTLQQQSIEVHNYSYCSLTEIQNTTAQKKDLIKTLFAFGNYYMNQASLESSQLQMYLETGREQTDYPISMNVVFESEQIKCNMMYDPNVYEYKEMEKVLRHYSLLVSEFSYDLSRKIALLPRSSEKDIDYIMKQFNHTKHEFNLCNNIVTLFQRQVEKSPSKEAIVYAGEALTYLELEEKSNQVANVLLEQGVQVEDFVGICLEKSLEMIIALLGVMKAGGAYVPIEPNLPIERIKYLIEDCKPRVILTYKNKWITNEKVTVIDLVDSKIWKMKKELSEPEISVHNLAYCIYTSGTTGNPKGVMVEHGGVINLAEFYHHVHQIRQEDRVLQFASYVFDASVTEFAMSLLNGGTLYILPEEIKKDFALCEQFLRDNKISVAVFPPPYLKHLNTKETFLRVLMNGGSEVDKKLVTANNHIELYVNEYGPTEITVLATYWQHKANASVPNRIPIGLPQINKQCFILQGDQFCDIGMAGELCISGVGLARGYLNREKLTQEKFTVNPISGDRMYRTGDLVRWNYKGELEYLGRIDEQVKIHGFRIELQEITVALLDVKSVKDAVVIARKNKHNENELYCYYVSDNELSIGEIRNELNNRLPYYMIPKYFMKITKIPMNQSGKIDKKRLPEIENTIVAHIEFPQTEVEKVLCGVFCSILEIEKMGTTDNFFECGGDSIKAMRVVSKMRQYGYQVSVKEIVEKGTIKAICKGMERLDKKMLYSQGEISGEVKKTPMLECFNNWNLNNPNYMNFYSLVPLENEFTEEHVEKALFEVVAHHDMLRAVYCNKKLVILTMKESRKFEFNTILIEEGEDSFNKIKEETDKIQSSFQLEEGPLLKAVLIKQANKQQLFICAHHIVVDMISWNILTEDLFLAMKQCVENKTVELPEKTTSFKEWSEYLEKYKDTDAVKSFEPYWRNIIDIANANTIQQIVEKGDGEKQEIEIEFTKQETDLLNQQANKKYRANTNDLIISAIAMAFQKIADRSQTVLELESHGRNKLDSCINVDRTIGWFTSIYPFIAECGTSIEETILLNKDNFRKSSEKGLTFGLLRDTIGDVRNSVNYNFLGNVNSNSDDGMDEGGYTGGSTAEENRIYEGIRIGAMVIDSKLLIYFTDDYGICKKKFLDKLALTVKECIYQIILESKAIEYARHSVTDFSAWELKLIDVQAIEEYYQEKLVDVYSLTSLQEGMLFHNLSNSQLTEYMIQHLIDLNGDVNEECLKQALCALSQKYDAFRTEIAYENLTSAVQVVLSEREIEYQKLDFADLSVNEQDRKIAEVERNNMKRGFHLQEDSLLRVIYIKTGKKTGKMIWCYHHIIIDGWCISLVYGDYMRYYNQLYKGCSLEQLLNTIQEERSGMNEYKSYISWLKAQDKEKGLQYWNNVLEGYEEVAKIEPMGIAKNSEEQVRKTGIILDKEESSKIANFSVACNVTMSTIVETAWGLLLQQYSCTDDVVFGKVESGRNADIEGIENIVGLFANTIPVRVESNDSTIIGSLLQNMQKQGTESCNYTYCSLADIQGKTQQKGELIKNLYVFGNYYVDKERIKQNENDLKMTIESDREQTNYEMTVCADYSYEQLSLSIMYNPGIYDEEEVQGILKRFQSILSYIIRNSDGLVKDIPCILEDEVYQVENTFNDTATDCSVNMSVAELFEEQVNKTPNNTAVVYHGFQYTYRELNEKSNQVAWKLRELDVNPNDRVMIITKRSMLAAVGIVGIIKSGGAYVPVDVSYPPERIEFIINDAKPKAILLYGVELKTKTDIPILYLDQEDTCCGERRNPKIVNQRNDLAYCMYTSGTTGHPKGVMIEQRSIGRLVKNTDYVQFDENIVMLQTGQLAFDASTYEIWGSLLNGGQVHFIDENLLLSFSEFKNYLYENRISTMFLTAALFNQMISYDCTMFNKMRHLMVGGEQLSTEHINLLRTENNKTEVINGYGPTETTTFAVTYNIKNVFDRRIPIGKPIANTQVYIIRDEKLCGIGVPGELCIGGLGVARGYMNRPELTKEKFVKNPYGDGVIYRSGDLCRWMLDGTIEYIGRIDEQVKIHGYRIELEEIESSLRKIDYITNAAVKVKTEKNGEKQLLGYIVSDVNVDVDKLKEELKKILPDYMVPSYMMQIDQIPITRNGKADKRALPEINYVDNAHLGTVCVAARSELEKQIMQIWSDILQINTISIYDSFFDIGGNSLLVVKMQLQIDKIYPGMIKIGDIFASATIEKLAELIELKDRGSVECEQLSFYDNFFRYGSELRHSFQDEDAGLLFKNAKQLREQDNAEYQSVLLVTYTYLMSNYIKEKEFSLCVAEDYEYFIIHISLQENTDLNELKETIKSQYLSAKRFKNTKLIIKKRGNGALPLFASDFSGNQQLKKQMDFSMEVYLMNNKIRFKSEIQNNRVSADVLKSMFKEYQKFMKVLLGSK